MGTELDLEKGLEERSGFTQISGADTTSDKMPSKTTRVIEKEEERLRATRTIEEHAFGENLFDK